MGWGAGGNPAWGRGPRGGGCRLPQAGDFTPPESSRSSSAGPERCPLSRAPPRRRRGGACKAAALFPVLTRSPGGPAGPSPPELPWEGRDEVKDSFTITVCVTTACHRALWPVMSQGRVSHEAHRHPCGSPGLPVKSKGAPATNPCSQGPCPVPWAHTSDPKLLSIGL